MLLKQALDERFEQISTQDPLKGLRQKSWERFTVLGFPDRKWEAFNYLPLTPFYAGVYPIVEDAPVAVDPHFLLPGFGQVHLVFVNGSFAPHLSHLPSGVVVLPLKEALTTYGNFLQQRWTRAMEGEKDPFVALNGALHSAGVFVYVPPKLGAPLQIQSHQIFTSAALITPRVDLFVGAHSEVEWVDTIQDTAEGGYWVNGVFDVALEEGASLKKIQLHHTLNSQGWFFDAVRATLKKGSRLEGVHVTNGAKSVRHDYHVALNGEGAEASLNGLSLLQGHRQSHTHVLMEHVAPHCRSKQFFKGALEGATQTSFEGKIFVHPEAQKTDAYQLNKTLLLGERALANSKPNLEVFADDVKASHGATVTQVDPSHLFYLRARGISKKAAEGLLIQAFCQEVVDKISLPSALEKLSGAVEHFCT